MVCLPWMLDLSTSLDLKGLKCWYKSFPPCPPSDLGSGDEKVKKVDCRKFLTPGYTTSGHVELYTVCSCWPPPTLSDTVGSQRHYLTLLPCVSFHRWVWREECRGRRRRMHGQNRTDQMMASMYRYGKVEGISHFKEKALDRLKRLPSKSWFDCLKWRFAGTGLRLYLHLLIVAEFASGWPVLAQKWVKRSSCNIQEAHWLLL